MAHVVPRLDVARQVHVVAATTLPERMTVVTAIVTTTATVVIPVTVLDLLIDGTYIDLTKTSSFSMLT